MRERGVLVVVLNDKKPLTLGERSAFPFGHSERKSMCLLLRGVSSFGLICAKFVTVRSPDLLLC